MWHRNSRRLPASFVSTAAGLAAVVSPAAFGIIADLTGSYRVPFIFSIGLLVVGVGLTFFIRADRPLIVDDAPDSLTHLVGVTR